MPAVSIRMLELPELDSTNAEAMRRAAAGEQGPLWIVAARQTAGRGRSGRSWTSTTGNLHASLLIHLARAGATAYQLSLVTGVALHDALLPLVSEPARGLLRLKWPNDVLIGAAKAAGILVESTTQPGTAGLVSVIGIGVNVTSHPDDLGRAATHLEAHGARVTARDIAARVGIDLARWLEIWDEGAGFAAVREAWLARGGPLGEALKVNTGAGQQPIAGRFAGLDRDGALLLVDEAGNVRRISYGDVTLAG